MNIYYIINDYIVIVYSYVTRPVRQKNTSLSLRVNVTVTLAHEL